MTREEYLRLCETCDAVLNENAASISLVAIGWLQVLNEHPSNQLKYALLFDQKPIKPRSYSSEIFTFIKDSIYFIESAFQKSVEPILQGKNEILFISHLLNKNQVSGDSDFYFGKLPEILIQKGISTATILINHTNLKNGDLEKHWRDLSPFKMPFPEALSPFEELKIRIILLIQSIRLKLKSRIEKDIFKKKVYYNSSFQALSQSSIFSLRTFLFVKKVIRNNGIRAVITTFEGHAYERMIFAAANTSKKKVFGLGYHHTIIFPQQHAALRKVDKKFRPDHILTAGNITKDEFSRTISSSSVHNIGIHRTESIDTSLPDISSKPSACIVLPDGILSEVLILFRFAIETARLAPEIAFILRLHPILKKEDILYAYPEFNTLPRNVSFSSNDFAMDLKRVRWALYRGSNSAIYAVMEGIRPVYISIPDELKIDSLDNLVSWKKIISEVPELVDVINGDLTISKKKLEEESKEAINFCKEYFMPLDIPRFLNIVGSCRN